MSAMFVKRDSSALARSILGPLQPLSATWAGCTLPNRCWLAACMYSRSVPQAVALVHRCCCEAAGGGSGRRRPRSSSWAWQGGCAAAKHEQRQRGWQGWLGCSWAVCCQQHSSSACWQGGRGQAQGYEGHSCGCSSTGRSCVACPSHVAFGSAGGVGGPQGCVTWLSLPGGHMQHTCCTCCLGQRWCAAMQDYKDSAAHRGHYYYI
jgi:hypothetical protein